MKRADREGSLRIVSRWSTEKKRRDRASRFECETEGAGGLRS